MLTLFNSLTKKLEDFQAPQHRPINLYSCGLTVYDTAHIGNLRSFIFADTVRRTLQFGGHKINWVINVTDVDDKTIRKTITQKGVSATKEDLLELTDQYHKKFLEDLEKLNIDTQSITFIKVSEVIPQIITFIERLLEKGYAYKTEDGVYFNIEKYQADFGDYGQLVGHSFLAGKKIGARVNVDEYDKDNLSDFALWKNKHQDDGEIFWESPFGNGRPGWHIECSVINEVGFRGAPTDIHTGGIDLAFPHHTNEIAQSQPIYKPFVRYWLHAEHLLVDGKKMAKRDNNFYTLSDLENKYGPRAAQGFRYLCLQSHYRTSFNFTDESLKAALTAITRLKNMPREQENGSSMASNHLTQDFNTPKALASIWESSHGMLTPQNYQLATQGLGINLSPDLEIIPETIKELARQREDARTKKDFALSDKLRDEILAQGYEAEDTPQGQKIKKSR